MEDEKIVDEQVVDNDKEVTEDDLRNLKYGNDSVEELDSDETDETDEDEEESEETDNEDSEETEETESDDESEFVKELPNIKGDTLEDYARNLEQTILESNREGKRLADKVKELESRIQDKTPKDESDKPSDVASLYMKQKMDEEITQAYSDFSKNFPQVKDEIEYEKFTKTVGTLSRTIIETEGRLASPSELYTKSAVVLGWEPANKIDAKESLKMNLKDKVSISKNPSSKPKAVKKSKVTDAMIVANRLMYPDKTDQQIREELEPYIQ